VDIPLVVALLLAGAALLWAVLLTVQVHEHCRYVRASLRNPARQWRVPPSVLVCVPCKGLDLELADNLRGVLSQEYPKYRVRFIVDHAADPACDVIRPLMASSAVPCELLVAGRCLDSGQKVHNLRSATVDLAHEIDVLAFFDSDARPAPDALARLVDRVCRAPLQVATGYRWFVPRHPTAANLTLASINASVASLMKHHGWNFIWGGCWAVTRELFEEAAVADAWSGTLSDDLVASRVLRLAGAQVVFEPSCMSASSIDVTWRQAAAFLRRQFVIYRCYAPLWWRLTVPLMVLQPLALLGGVALAAVLARRGEAFWYWPLLVSAFLFATAVLRGHWRQATWISRFGDESSTLRAAARFDRWASAWSCLFAVGAMLAASAGRTLSWRGLYYHVGPAGRITVLGRTLSDGQYTELTIQQARRFHQEEAARCTAVDGSRAA
jgi:hypothetical protein